MLSNHCGRNWSSRKSIPRRPTYSSLSRYPKSSCRRVDEQHNSPSISVSDETQKLTGGAAGQRCGPPEANGGAGKARGHLPVAGGEAGRKPPREFGRSISRSSNSSQLTLMTSVSKGFNEGNNNVAATCVNECLLKIRRPPRTAVTFGKKGVRLASSRAAITAALRPAARLLRAGSAVKPGFL